ncbi:FAD-dependent thymidylate synthase [Candidatus Cyrtobacter comes]|uniref:Flavin-dependent thymidylate synthase n=1 Tax=Candidatus Cyrtobacter comes TaxID=675776 RepID=A0ABU5L7K1_9RICK|nr:FAD-dependent thymidylate synthase [Candidatus Cyrtobacter comes]MDZ5762101.1 FAD-dependent thymidylate synthase [Candidatus Cyrtobacter comes]
MDNNQILELDKSKTLRPTVEALEEILYKPINVLDHGFIRVIDYMGDDSAIVQAARVSYGKGTKKMSQDKGLINYLMKHAHTTPFEMCEIKLHVKLPIFVARQWVRHRTANINEYSARYSILDKEFYIPSADQISYQSISNKQGRGEVLDHEDSQKILDMLRQDAERCYENYAYMLNIDEETGEVLDESRNGVARELARMNLTLNYYTQWYWKIDLHNLMHFLKLRSHHHAQYEIRVYAEKMLEILKRWVPCVYDAFINYSSGSFNLSKTAIKVIHDRLSGVHISKENSGLSAREWDELKGIFPNL